jgi:hypothetical protein
MRSVIGFFAFIIFILIGLFGIWYGLKSHGESREVSSYQTPLVRELLETTQNGALLIDKNSESLTLARAKHDQSGWQVDGNKPLSDLKQLAQTSPVLLFVEWKSPKALPELRQLVKEEKLGNRIIFCSRNDGLLKDIREIEPEWTFCNGEVFQTRMFALNSLGLQAVMKISADVFFIHLDNVKLSLEFATLVKEAKRQNKLVIIGPVTRPMKGLSPHAWLIQN